MGDADSNIQPSKKRSAGVQLTRDNPDFDDDEETSELEAGTFKKASEEVLATRKIVQVRRQQTSSIASASASLPTSNPFGAIRLVPPATASSVEMEKGVLSSKETGEIVTEDCKSGKAADEVKGESSGGAHPSDVQSRARSVESKVVESDNTGNSPGEAKETGNNKNVETNAANKRNDGEKGDGKVNTESTEAKSNQNVEKDEKDKRNNAEKGNGDVTTKKNAESALFSSFRQLSSSQNAFSGLAQTGFSSTTFSFGSIPMDGSASGCLFGWMNDKSPFGFSISNGASSSIFRTSGSNFTDKSEGDTPLSSKQEVPLETGEENEKAVFTSDAALFEYIDGAWKERGKGELKLNVPMTGTGKARLVMRARGIYRLVLNATLLPDMKLTNMDKKGITFACVNIAGERKDGLSTIALKFKDAAVVESFRAAMMEHKTTTAVALRTPENSP